MVRLEIVSGGQTGVDRAALDAAIALSLPYSGWCPKGGWAEDRPAPPGLHADYPALRETPLADPAQRTEWNVRDGDAVLIVLAAGGADVSKGTGLARDLAARHRKPLFVATLGAPDIVDQAVAWLSDVSGEHPRGTAFKLGIGGPRESEAPGIYDDAFRFLLHLLRRTQATL